MTKISKTINPLHFEDLEPHRFEDLARQLVYDFREWANLEATGSAGSDEGFDARGREIIYDIEDRDEEEEAISQTEERIWLIQCKREKSIPPKKIEKYLKDILTQNKEPLHGIIFIAACNFSKKARDTFISEIRKEGIKEFQIWGKAEMEDMLFQPKNDHLLFAYFGISLTIRKRSLKTKLRSRVATKKKALRCLENQFHQPVLLRDAYEKKYPYSRDVPNFDDDPKWKVYDFIEQNHAGLSFLVARFKAYLADDQKNHDYMDLFNEGRPHNDPWPRKDIIKVDRNKAQQLWSELPDKNRGHFEVKGIVEYDNILAIDDLGDDVFRGPHFYIPFLPKKGPFSYFYIELSTYGEGRVTIYPKKK